jgi:hypothetical protein
MKKEKISTNIKKDTLRKKTTKLAIDTIDEKTKKQIYRIIKEHQSEFDRLK